MAKYRKCPRCEVNYILEEEEMCSVCIAELEGIIDKDLEEELCPRCEKNYVVPGEKY